MLYQPGNRNQTDAHSDQRFEVSFTRWFSVIELLHAIWAGFLIGETSFDGLGGWVNTFLINLVHNQVLTGLKVNSWTLTTLNSGRRA